MLLTMVCFWPSTIFHQLILSYWSSGSICIPIGALLNAAIVIFVLVRMYYTPEQDLFFLKRIC